jgi:Na+/H+-translocating membrane pyrophosphatase
MMQNATAMIGLLVGFLIVGIIGVYTCSVMVESINLSADDALYESQQTILETFELGINLCKIIIIVSIAGLVFMILQKMGLVPSLGGGGNQGGY